MGVTIHYDFCAAGDEARVRGVLDLVRAEFLGLPVQRVSDIERIHPVRFKGGVRGVEALVFSLGLHLQFHFHVFALPERERKLIERRILGEGNGLGFYVDVAEGCDPFRVTLGRVGNHPVWSGGDFTKTAWANDWERAHRLVIQLLEVCDAADMLDEVCDEAGIWQESHAGA